jgi:hypothetical protein
MRYLKKEKSTTLMPKFRLKTKRPRTSHKRKSMLVSLPRISSTFTKNTSRVTSSIHLKMQRLLSEILMEVKTGASRLPSLNKWCFLPQTTTSDT